MKKIFKCTECSKPFTLDDCELPEPRTINDDTEQERIVCDTCFDNMWDNDDLTHCDNCGIWFENKLIHEEIIGDHCGSASIHPDEIIVITEDANKEKHRMQIIKSNIYR